MIFARDELIAKKPELVERFLRGWFETIAFMRANKERTVEITAKVLNLDKAVISRVYDEQIKIFTADGKLRSQGAGGDPPVAGGDGHPAAGARGRRDVHHAISAGEVLTAPPNRRFSVAVSDRVRNDRDAPALNRVRPGCDACGRQGAPE